MDAIERLKPKRVVIDSLPEIVCSRRVHCATARQILALKHYFARYNSTVMLLDDMTTESIDSAVHSTAHRNRGKSSGTGAFFSCADSSPWTLYIMCCRHAPFPR